MYTKKNQFLTGFKAVAPIFLGASPFGLIVGVTAISIGMSAAQGISMSALVFAGASQLAAMQLAGTGASLFVIWMTVGIINLRHVMYSASIAPYFKHLPLRWRLLMPIIMADQVYALPLLYYQAHPERPNKRWYYLGVGLPLACAWLTSTAVGVFLGAQIPPEWALDFVIPLVFMVLIFPTIKNRAGIWAAAASGITAVLARPLPYNLGLVLAAVTGIAVGITLEELGRRQPAITPPAPSETPCQGGVE